MNMSQTVVRSKNQTVKSGARMSKHKKNGMKSGVKFTRLIIKKNGVINGKSILAPALKKDKTGDSAMMSNITSRNTGQRSGTTDIKRTAESTREDMSISESLSNKLFL